MKVDELLRLACIYAEQDRIQFIDAMSNCTTEEDREIVNREKEYLKELIKYRNMRWGRSKAEELIENCEYKTLDEIRELYEEPGGLPR